MLDNPEEKIDDNICPKCNGEIESHQEMLLNLELRISESHEQTGSLWRQIKELQKQIRVRQEQLAQLYSGQAGYVVNLQNEEARLHSEIRRLNMIKNKME